MKKDIKDIATNVAIGMMVIGIVKVIHIVTHMLPLQFQYGLLFV